MKKLLLLSLFLVSISCAQDTTPPATPSGVKAIGYELHADVIWQNNTEADLAGYRVYKFDGSTFTLSKTVKKYRSFHWEWINTPGVTVKYKVSAYDNSGNESPLSAEVSAQTHSMTDDEFLDMTQRATFRYFWDWGDPNSGLARERWHPNESDVTNTIGGSGFGIMGIVAAVERGFITREQGAQRMLKITTFLVTKADRFHGVFPHWLNGSTGKVVNFGQQNGGDIVETAFLIEGLLTARQYFDNNSPDEVQTRAYIKQIWEEVDWNFYRNGTTGLYWNWSPTMGFNFSDTFVFHGWNETQIAYILAVASPTKAPLISPIEFYKGGWGNGGSISKYRTKYDIPLYVGTDYGGSLFWTHYSYIGFDPRNKRDLYTNYFVHNKNQTLVNRAYCIANPKKFAGYQEDCWGLTASYSIPSVGYTAHEPNNDNGTISPTAALSAMPYTPKESIAALKHFYRIHGADLWGDFGFKDAFNISNLWFSDGYLAIDQGPIVGMIENYRSEILWKKFMSSPEIAPILDFSSGKGLFFPDTKVEEESIPTGFKLEQNYPNPFNPETTISYKVQAASQVGLKIYDALGREVTTLVNEYKQPGNYKVRFNVETRHGASLQSGVFFYTLTANGFTQTKKMLLIK
ncbi:MAG: T9SS type A sorting domain-containing protein [Ignavibacteriales bacterium]|nr:T9SS type A sorting domain-containing protein [Ignavibacteriales bacterium]